MSLEVSLLGEAAVAEVTGEGPLPGVDPAVDDGGGFGSPLEVAGPTKEDLGGRMAASAEPDVLLHPLHRLFFGQRGESEARQKFHLPACQDEAFLNHLKRKD